ncbi:NADP-dependent oxidoreductase [Sphingobium sp. JS3065]|uniref:NADP-dependent oxidoreductase n=1 Tax=Sphingobium sp. JS3065 TaxID=2970925 RepID=UPI0022650082|nr:NADP-dependent oxidoreductase [Sphingobium sp. JS3065]UZW57041.1 NADP-dependent oxidoreductase [Sphingobium sp. JS3065]
MMMHNGAVILKNRPTGIASAKDFVIEDRPLLSLEDGQIRVRNLYLSVEPAMRGWIADTGNYVAPVPLGAVMRALAVGEVVETRDTAFGVGEIVTGWFGWQEIATVTAAEIVRRVVETDLPVSLALGVLGINGVTAHLALTLVGQPEAGDTVLVSTAAGSVGSAVGQIANILGCRTIGIAGGAEKVALCREVFGYSAALDYRADDLDAGLAALSPDGVNVYFDNTAGPISDIALRHLALRARVVVCGTAAISDWTEWPQGPRVERRLLTKRARMEGFVIFDHMDRYEASVAQLAQWVREGCLIYREDIKEGLESCTDALASLYRGENLGKRLIRL